MSIGQSQSGSSAWAGISTSWGLREKPCIHLSSPCGPPQRGFQCVSPRAWWRLAGNSGVHTLGRMGATSMVCRQRHGLCEAAAYGSSCSVPCPCFLSLGVSRCLPAPWSAWCHLLERLPRFADNWPACFPLPDIVSFYFILHLK